MPIQVGTFLQSTAALQGSIFDDVLLFITESNAKGAIGFVINKPFERRLNELVEFKDSPAFPLYDGGPVDKEHLFFVHRRPDLIEEGVTLNTGIYNGGHFKQAVAAIQDNHLTTTDIKIFIGYCGWDSGELEAEIEEGSWEVIHRPIDVFMN